MERQQISGDAKRGAAKFIFIGAVVMFTGVCLVCASPLTAYKAFLYCMGGAVCCYLAWPSQDEGDADLRNNRK